MEARAEGNPTTEQKELMLQSLLAERFKLVVHHETRQPPICVLVTTRTGRTGPQLLLNSGEEQTCVAPMLPGFGASFGTKQDLVFFAFRASPVAVYSLSPVP
jgi:uncharacterized protein (TIGR03435 family)